MNHNELRKLDRKVHEILYPDDIIMRGADTWARDGSGKIPSYFIPCTGGRDIRLPKYTKDISAWDGVFALKPEWMWKIRQWAEGTYIDLLLTKRGHPTRVIQCEVSLDEATGLSAWALGMARCVEAWGEEQHANR